MLNPTSYPITDGTAVTDAHVRVCRERGHATYIVDGVVSDICPRCGEFTATEEAHNVYPHVPGSLFDCAACEASCHCVPGETECVHCAIKAERKINRRAIRYIDRFSY